MAKKEPFRDKLLFLQEKDIHSTVNMVMVPEMFEDFYEEALFFHEAGINVTLKPQSDPTASRVVPGYTPEQWKLLHNGMPQRNYTNAALVKSKKKSVRPKPSQKFRDMPSVKGDDPAVPLNLQVELRDKEGKRYYLDQAERFNAFEFNKFRGWKCHAGFQGIVIREPDGSIKRSYSCHDEPIGNILEDFQIFKKPKECITPTCVSSVDSKMPKYREGYENS
jgi:hypothetical protein